MTSSSSPPSDRRSVLVTGANSGIGLATALELGGAGYRVFGTARSEEKADDLRAAAEAKGLSEDVVRPIVCDVGDADSAPIGFAQVAEQTGGGPWAIVNNAGYAQAGTVEDVDDEAVRAQLEINLVAPARLARLALPTMRERGSGRIVNVGSMAGRISLPLMGWYCASKSGLAALTESLRMEVGQYGVHAVLVEPGSFGTSIWAGGNSTLPEPATEEYRRAYGSAGLIDRHSGLLPDPVWVARVIRLALGSPRPLPRYLVGVDAVGGTLLDRVVPSPITDYVKTVTAGMRRLPFLPGR